METADDSLSTISTVSSGLTSPASRSPTPPAGFLDTNGHDTFGYPSPPPTQQSSAGGSPVPEDNDMTKTRAREGEGAPPPAKRRKTAHPKPRTTMHLDLRANSCAESQSESVDRLLNILRHKRKIVVVAGAGISVAAGIPDFRSSSGLFSTLRKHHKLKGSGKHLFDASVYKDDNSTTSFHEMVRNMSRLTQNANPTDFHHLLATLAHEGRLLRLYSQNVDGIDTRLEPLATKVPLGLKAPWPKTIQLHGGLDKMVCSKCGELSNFKADLFSGPDPPVCITCKELDHARTEIAGKRSHGIGRLRPRLVLYNEHNPDDEAIGAVTKSDLRTRPDALIVVGTTLKVPGVKRIVKEMARVVRSRRDGLTAWINNDPEPVGIDFKDCWDLVIRGQSDAVAKLAAMRRWDDGEEVPEEVWSMKVQDKPRVVLEASGRVTRWKIPRDFGSPQTSPERPAPELLSPPPSPSSLNTANFRAKHEESGTAEPVEKVEFTKPIPRKNPASKGLPLKQTFVINNEALEPKKARAPAKKGRPPKVGSRTQPAKITTQFKTTKPGSVAAKSSKTVSQGSKLSGKKDFQTTTPASTRPEPGHPSDFRSFVPMLNPPLYPESEDVPLGFGKGLQEFQPFTPHMGLIGEASPPAEMVPEINRSPGGTRVSSADIISPETIPRGMANVLN